MTNEQSLQNLYAAARLAALRAEEHDIVRKCAEQISEALKQLAEKKEE